jgi:colanic acid/amylovoran biosynthesis glycosyltransferase
LKANDDIMRIAYLINQYPKISQSFIRREIQALERNGHEIMRVSLRGWDLELADDADRVERERTRYVLRDGAPALLLSVLGLALRRPLRLSRALHLAWRMSRRAERPLLIHLIYVAEACRIEPWLSKGNVEHVHAHFGTNSAEVAMLVHVLGGPRWSFTAHGTETFDNPQLVGLTEKILRCAFAVAVSSYGRAQMYRVVSPRYWHKVQLVRCGLDPEFLTPLVAAGEPKQQLVCIARLSPEKGHITLLEAARRVIGQGIDFKLVLAGDGELRAEIEGLIAKYALTNIVRVTGWISGGQVRDVILSSRALVLASFAEGLPVVLMEAMALGRPVIATSVGGIPELVRAGENGWLVPAGDIEALSDAMRACLATPADSLARMGGIARERVLARHDVDTEAKKLERLFQGATLTGSS